MSLAVYHLPYDTTGKVLDGGGMDLKHDPTHPFIPLEDVETDDKKNNTHWKHFVYYSSKDIQDVNFKYV